MAETTGVLTPEFHQREGAARFDEAIERRTLRVGIVGLGYTGLPLGLGFAADREAWTRTPTGSARSYAASPTCRT
jgi:hypothetical protein